MIIRTESWGRSDLSWSRVMERLLHAAEKLGHQTVFQSTNGYSGMQYWDRTRFLKTWLPMEKDLVANDKQIDIDITYCVPSKFPERFHARSKLKIGRFDYESSDLPVYLRKNLNYPDLLVGSSEFVLDVFRKAGADEKKLRKIWSGVDLEIFNPNGPKFKIEKLGVPKDSFVFLSVAEPHYRKQLDRLIKIYCERFTKDDKVVLLIKTKTFSSEKEKKEKRNFEMDIFPYLAEMREKYGDKMPPIKIIGGFWTDLAPLYRCANVFCLPTVGEGWGMPFLEAMACGNLVISPNYGGQLEFLNDSNSMLCPVDIKDALPQEQYGGVAQKEINMMIVNKVSAGVVGRPKEDIFGDMMIDSYKNYNQILSSKKESMIATAKHFSWETAAKQLIDMAKE